MEPFAVYEGLVMPLNRTNVDTAQIIISESNLDEILEQITIQTFRLMKARLCSVFLPASSKFQP